MPSAIALDTAALSELDICPLILKFITAGVPCWWCATAQSIPATMLDVHAKAPQSNVLTGIITTFGAADLTTPATCVPCPLQSPVPSASLTFENPEPTLPDKST